MGLLNKVPWNQIEQTCKTCKERFNSGIWLAPQFADEGILLFCSEKCKKEYIKNKLKRIKSGYPRYYKKLKGKMNNK